VKLQLCSGSHFVGFEGGETIFTFRLGNDGFFSSDDLPHSVDFYNNLEVLFPSDAVVLAFQNMKVDTSVLQHGLRC
jgi:hypothetical protein